MWPYCSVDSPQLFTGRLWSFLERIGAVTNPPPPTGNDIDRETERERLSIHWTDEQTGAVVRLAYGSTVEADGCREGRTPLCGQHVALLLAHD